MPGPLEGLKVLDIATILAGPFAASMLADYGADVVKMELPGVGDGLRGFPPLKDGKSLWWKVSNRNKKMATLDLRKPEGAKLFKAMLAKFDVLIENFRPGTLERWGLDRDTLWAANPKLVILRVTAFGQDGPYNKRPGFARIFEAMSGLTHITGEADGSPIHNGYPIGDSIGGLFGTASILAALYRVKSDPDAKGEEIDLSLTEASFKLLDFLAIEHDQLGDVRQRSGNRNQYSAPSNVFRTSDGRYVSLAGSTNVIFRGNAKAIGRPELADDPRFATNVERVKNTAAIEAIFREWIEAHTQAEVCAAFDEAGGTLAPIYDIAQIYADPQYRARKAITEVPDADFGTVKMQNVVPRFRNRPGEVRHAAGAMGADNAEVFGEMLGLSEAELAALKADGVI